MDFIVQQKLTQHCKAGIPQSKIVSKVSEYKVTSPKEKKKVDKNPRAKWDCEFRGKYISTVRTVTTEPLSEGLQNNLNRFPVQDWKGQRREEKS